MKKVFYLISLRILANKILAFSEKSVSLFPYKHQNNEWITYRTSFNVIIIKNGHPKKDYNKIYDTIQLLIINNHIKKFGQ